MTLDLSEEEAAALLRELDEVIESERYPFSPRTRTLRGRSSPSSGRSRFASLCRGQRSMRRRAEVGIGHVVR
jgi:hypothetical protein